MKGHKKEHNAISPQEEKIIEEGLAAIYGEERDDLSKMDKAGSRVTRYLVRGVMILAFFAVLAYGAYFVYMRFFSGPGEDPFIVRIEAPTEMVSGATNSVTIHYENTANVPIASASIDINLPDAFVPTGMIPQATRAEELIWDLGYMEKKEQGTIVLEGTWLTSVPSTKNIQALATYRPANFNADFDAVASTSLTTVASTLALTATGEEQAMPGEAATYSFTVTNSGQTVMPSVVLALDLPEGFFIESAVPVLEAGTEAEWSLGDLAPAAVQIVSVTGSFASTVSDVQQLRATALVHTNEQRLTQGEASVFTDVEGNGLIIQLVGNGTSTGVTMDPGDPLRLTLGYENKGDVNLSGISLLVDFQGEGKFPITWSAAALDGGRMTPDGVRFEGLSLAAGEDKMKNLTFPVKTEIGTEELQEWKVVVHATLNGVTIKSQPLTVKLNSDAAFSSRARYYDANGAPLGEGPLPPQVDATTEYDIVWSLLNELHPLRDVRASATIPANVTWIEGKTEYGSVEFDTGTRTVSWTMPNAAESTGTLEAVFRVSITPDEDDVGRFVKLMSGTAFRATDTVTSSTIQQTTDALTTELEGDEEAAGRGVVEK